MTPDTMPPGTYVLPQTFTDEKRADVFGEIILTYDLIENLLAAVQRENNPARATELEMVNPFVTQATNSFNIISAFYTEITRKNLSITPEVRETMVNAYRNFYIALKELIDTMYEEFMPKEAL